MINKGMKKMKTRYWYGQSIKNPQKALAAFFDFQDINTTNAFIKNICTYAASNTQYQPNSAAQCILNFYALQSLLVTGYNLLNCPTWQAHFNKLVLQQMDAEQAMATKDRVWEAMHAIYTMNSLKKWRIQLFEILSDALWDKVDGIEYNATLIYMRLTDFVNAAYTVHRCIKESTKAPK